MKLSEFKRLLAQHPGRNIHFVLPTGTKIPLHAHVTDVARIDKQFIDCGGTIRTESICRLQTWFADDTEHRVGTNMLLKVLGKAASFLKTEDLEMDVEYEAPFISQFPIAAVGAEGDRLTIHLGIRHTICLAPDQCLPSSTKTDSILSRSLPSLKPVKCC
jgi:hypothetical protein